MVEGGKPCALLALCIPPSGCPGAWRKGSCEELAAKLPSCCWRYSCPAPPSDMPLPSATHAPHAPHTALCPHESQWWPHPLFLQVLCRCVDALPKGGGVHRGESLCRSGHVGCAGPDRGGLHKEWGCSVVRPLPNHASALHAPLSCLSCACCLCLRGSEAKKELGPITNHSSPQPSSPRLRVHPAVVHKGRLHGCEDQAHRADLVPRRAQARAHHGVQRIGHKAKGGRAVVTCSKAEGAVGAHCGVQCVRHTARGGRAVASQREARGPVGSPSWAAATHLALGDVMPVGG